MYSSHDRTIQRHKLYFEWENWEKCTLPSYKIIDLSNSIPSTPFVLQSTPTSTSKSSYRKYTETRTGFDRKWQGGPKSDSQRGE